MKKLCTVILAVFLMFVAVGALAYEYTPVNFVINGQNTSFRSQAIIRDGVTYVSAKEISGKLALSYKVFSSPESVLISSNLTSLCFAPNDAFGTVADLSGVSDHEFIFRQMTAMPIYINNEIYISARDIASVFGYPLSYNKEKATVYLGYSPDMISADTLLKAQSLTYYFQNQAEFALPNFGSGYCWTTSYAMLISNAKGERITPVDVANVNISSGYNGEYCYHSKIAQSFGVRFVNALPAGSLYYAGREDTGGGTYISNPLKQDDVVRSALREALTLHPEGVMVRYAAYPHTMVAVAFDGDIILFNDPAAPGGSYSEVGNYHAVPFNQTCVGARGFKLSDITFIQAID